MGATEGMLGWPGKAREPFRDLLVQPALVWYLNQLVGQGFILDRAPEVWCEETSDTTAPLVGGNEPRDPAIAYYFQNGRRFSEGVRVLWALEDVEEGDGGFVLVPCSHKGNVATPEELATGADDMGLVFQPVLKAGDLLIVGLATVQGMRPWKGARTSAAVELRICGARRDPQRGDWAEDRSGAAPGMARRLE